MGRGEASQTPAVEPEQVGFVICVAIENSATWPGLQKELVERQLDALGNPARSDIQHALEQTQCIHFMSMNVVADDNGRAFLLLEISGDGRQKAIIDKLVDCAGAYLLPVLETACGVDAEKTMRARLHKDALLAGPSPFDRAVLGLATGLPFQGTPNLSCLRIKKDERIAELAAQAIKEKHARTGRASARDYWRSAKRSFEKNAAQTQFVGPGAAGLSKFDLEAPASRFNIIFTILRSSMLLWAIGAVLGLSLGYFLLIPPDATPWRAGFHVLGALTLGVFTVVLLAALGAATMVFWLRATENKELEIAKQEGVDPDPDLEVVQAVMRRENRRTASGAHIAQNHMFAVSTIKPGFFRSEIVLVLGLHIVGLLVQMRIFPPGYLSDIGTIHFAQWIRIPRTRKLIFLSNYDGGWDAYLEDFITKAYQGLNLIWSNTKGYPATRFAVQDGAKDGDRFKRWARRQQLPTRFWYTAYPTLTTAQIRSNAKIREGLAKKDMNLTEAEDWLNLFGSAPRPFYALESEEVQSIVLASQRSLWAATCLLVRFDSKARAKSWVKGVCRRNRPQSTQVRFGQGENERHALFLALTATGLERLGIDGARGAWPDNGELHLPPSFPPAFALGMADPTRRELLGDVDESASQKWLWGGARNPVDAALLIYARADQDIERLRRVQTRYLKALGLEVVHTVKMRTLSQYPVTEPFGFTDGISQPIIRGAEGSSIANAVEIVEPGEFILGYRDGRGFYPPSPGVPADPDNQLPDGSRNFPDFGCNGSYLVIRQLEQDVAGFWSTAREEAKRIGRTAEWVAAKMVGRWQNGAPLARYPDAPPPRYNERKQENDFLYGQDDPQGLGCPLGAHIRRANPRDSFNVGDPDQMAITNRHRLLRRGRPYVLDSDNKQDGGILFMCLNADIERQFEFVQQTWISSNANTALRGEFDPIASSSGAAMAYTIPMTSGPEQLQLKCFVTVRGGAYFFLPSKRALNYLSTSSQHHAPARERRNRDVGLLPE